MRPLVEHDAFRRHRHRLVLKMETARAVRNLPDMVVRAAGRQPAAIVITRGDLTNAGTEKLSQDRRSLARRDNARGLRRQSGEGYQPQQR
jgi:hypothetical protein